MRSRRIGSLLILAMFLGCGPTPEPVVEVPPGSSQTEVYLAISGGGWRTHTAQSAWMIGLLDLCRANTANPVSCDLQHLLSNVKGISTNSGGSWFNTMLAYSPDFHDALTAPNAYRTWGVPPPTITSGWLGYQRSLLGGPWNEYCKTKFDCFDCEGCDSCEPSKSCSSCASCDCLDEAFVGKIDHLTSHPLVWMDTIQEIVFEPWGMASELGKIMLSDTSKRLPWAQGKTLLLAATMVTDEVVLTESSDYLNYSVMPSTPRQWSVTPVTFASLPALTPHLVAPHFFPFGDMTLEYGEESTLAETAPPPVTIRNAAGMGNVPVLVAAAASSAAGGAEASVSVEKYQGARAPWLEAYEASDLAPAFRFDTNPIQQVRNLPTTLKTLSDQKIARLADGGFLDNSAVAHVINFLQGNSVTKDFNIVAFDNVQDSTSASGIDVPIDIAYLFGKGRPDPSKFCATVHPPTDCVKVPIATVFAESGLATGQSLWEHEDRSGNKLSYTKYTVTTVHNPTLGVTAGSTGTLHVMASIYPSARTAPLTGDCDFDTYDSLLEFIYTGLTANTSAEVLLPLLGSVSVGD